MATRRAPRASIACFVVALALPLVPGATGAAALDFAAARSGEAWRLWTGHWAHGSPDHLLWDALAFLALAWACERREGTDRLCVFLAVCAPAISLAVMLWAPTLVSYRGLSGLDSALFVWLVAGELARAVRARSGSRTLWACALAMFLAKICWETLHGGTLFVDSSAAGLEPVPLAHLAGAVAGAAAILLPPRAASRTAG